MPPKPEEQQAIQQNQPISWQIQLRNIINTPGALDFFVNGFSEEKEYTEFVACIRNVFDDLPANENLIINGSANINNSSGDFQLIDMDGQAYGSVSQMRSISSKKDLEEELNEAEKGYRLSDKREHLKNVLSFMDQYYKDVVVDKDVYNDFNKIFDESSEELNAGNDSSIEINFDEEMSPEKMKVNQILELDRAKAFSNKFLPKEKILADDENFLNDLQGGKGVKKQPGEDYHKGALRFDDPSKCMDTLRQLDDVYHQMYKVSNRLTDSGEFKKMLGNLKEIHEVYTYAQKNDGKLPTNYSPEHFSGLMSDTATNTEKYIGKLGADKNFRSSEKGNTKLLGAVQVLSAIDYDVTKEKYSGLKFKMPDGEKVKAVTDLQGLLTKDNSGISKISYESLIQKARKNSSQSDKIRDNAERQKRSRMEKRVNKTEKQKKTQNNLSDNNFFVPF